jgi:hypothetical protein
MAEMADAALERIRLRMELIPAMSTTEYIMVMSVSSIYDLILPEAIVETMSLGKPIAQTLRIMVQAREEPELPAAETIPWTWAFETISLTGGRHSSIAFSMNSPRGSLESFVP